MIPKIKRVEALPDYLLSVSFEDGTHVLYSVAEDMREIPSYQILRAVPGLFQQVQLDQSRTCVFWNEDVDLASDSIYDYGMKV